MTTPSITAEQARQEHAEILMKIYYAILDADQAKMPNSLLRTVALKRLHDAGYTLVRKNTS